MAERRPSNEKRVPLWILEPALEWLRGMSAESLWLVFHDFIRIFVVLTVLLWFVELFHRYGTDPTKTIRTGWVRWLANRLEWAVDYKATFWAIMIALALACGIALVKEAVPPDDPTTRSETKKPTSAFSSPKEPPPHQRDVTLSTTSLTALELMEIVALGGQEAVQSQVGLSLQVRGQFLKVTIMPSGFDAKKDRRPSRLAALFEVVLEWDADGNFPEKSVYVYVDYQHEREVARITDRTEVIAVGTIQEIERNSLSIGNAKIIPIR